jgi:hypothetical protein
MRIYKKKRKSLSAHRCNISLLPFLCTSFLLSFNFVVCVTFSTPLTQEGEEAAERIRNKICHGEITNNFTSSSAVVAVVVRSWGLGIISHKCHLRKTSVLHFLSVFHSRCQKCLNRFFMSLVRTMVCIMLNTKYVYMGVHKIREKEENLLANFVMLIFYTFVPEINPFYISLFEAHSD